MGGPERDLQRSFGHVPCLPYVRIHRLDRRSVPSVQHRLLVFGLPVIPSFVQLGLHNLRIDHADEAQDSYLVQVEKCEEEFPQELQD